MNQLFYNIAGGIVHQIRREKPTTIGIGFISNFLLKARILFYCSLNKKFFIFKKKSRSRTAL